MKPARMPSTARVRECCSTASTHRPATSTTLSSSAGSGAIRSSLNAANTVNSSTPIAPPCTARAKAGLSSRWRQPNISPAMAAAATPARRSSTGTRNQPWSLAYLSNAATPASSTSMPIFTGTFPPLNQRPTARASTVKRSRAGGSDAREKRCADARVE